jgi:hypothetical protein
MTLEETILQRLADWRPTGSERETLTISGDKEGWSVSLVVDRYDDLSCALWEMGERSQSGKGLSRPGSPQGLDLKAWAEKVAAGVRVLIEPLRVVEIDAQRNEALLRSAEPAARKNERYYYELLLNGAGYASVRRYKGTTEVGRRQQIAFTLTHEAVARLAGDLSF